MKPTSEAKVANLESRMAKSKPAVSTSGIHADYGWRLHGRTVSVLKDRSFTLIAESRPAAMKMLAGCHVDTSTLVACLQCGMCTASCNLAEEGSLFPRHEMTMVQLGQKDRLLADSNIWHCFNCSDCSSRCPSKARPGRIMAAIRQMAVEHYAFPNLIGRAINSPRALAMILVVPALLILAAIAIGGSFTPQTSPVLYASMFPHLALNLFFSAFTAFAAMSMLISAGRIWHAFIGESLWKGDLLLLVRSFITAVREILSHRKFSECEEFPLSRWAHMAIFYGFMTLFVLAGVVALLILFGAPYPLPAQHPLKIIGNLAGILFLAGIGYFIVQRYRSSLNDDKSSWFDWAVLFNLLLVGVTGMLTEIFRYADSAILAYPIYFFHLLFVLILFMSIPYSKLAHLVYRTVAMAARSYETLVTEALTHTTERKAVA